MVALQQPADAPGAWPAPRAIYGAARARNGRGRPAVLARRICGRGRDFGLETATLGQHAGYLMWCLVCPDLYGRKMR